MARNVVEQLQEIKENNPHLAEAVDLHSDLIQARSAVDVHPIVVAQYDTATIREWFSEGIPLVRAEEIALDWDAFSWLYQDVCRIAAQHRPDLAAVFEGLLTALQQNPEEIRALTAVFLNDGNVREIGSDGDAEMQNDESHLELLNFVLTHTLHPFLKPYSNALKPILEEQLGSDWDKGWQRGRCPICGGEPDFAFLDGDAGARHLVCARCDNSWLFPRIKCAFCDTTEPSDLSYYPSTDDVHRVYVCLQCKRYLKAVDKRGSPRPVSIEVERVSTMDLDLEAREQGYR